MVQYDLPPKSYLRKGQRLGSLQHAPQAMHRPLRFFATGKSAVTVLAILARHVFLVSSAITERPSSRHFGGLWPPSPELSRIPHIQLGCVIVSIGKPTFSRMGARRLPTLVCHILPGTRALRYSNAIWSRPDRFRSQMTAEPPESWPR